jgi:hypothetical protein
VEFPQFPEMRDLGDSGASNYGYDEGDMLAFAEATVALRAQAAEGGKGEALTFAQLNECVRDAQIDFALDKATSFEVAFARRIEKAHGIGSPAPGAGGCRDGEK